jgi:serine O-acetyltransferase
VFENVREDWQSHQRLFNRHGFYIMLIYRFGRWRYTIHPRAVRMPFSLLYEWLKFFSVSFLGAEIPCEVTIGRRFVIEHVGAIVISGEVVIGDDCILRQGVTIGLRNKGVLACPRLGNRVDIGAGAKILGPITIGDDVAIGANAVVLTDVPANHLAVGVPAKIIPRKRPATNS